MAKHFCDIRKKAIQCLEKQSTDTIRLIMLQLMQAYRYENFEDSYLKKFFFKRVFENIEIVNTFHWLLHLDKENDGNGEII